MYGNTKTIPFSTYASGEAGPAAIERGGGGRKSGLAVLAMLGTASVIAISFSVTELAQSPVVPGGSSRPTASHDRAHQRPAEPGFLYEFDSSQFSPAPARPRALPAAGVALGNASGSARLAPGPPRALRPRVAASPSRPSQLGYAAQYESPGIHSDPGRPPDSSELRACQSECSANLSEKSVEMSAQLGSGPIEASGAAPGYAVAGEPGDRAAAATGQTLPRPGTPQLVADSMPVDGILADRQHGTLTVPPAALIASEAEAADLAQARPISPSASPDPVERSPSQASQVELEVQDGDAAFLASAESQGSGGTPAIVSQNDRVPAARGSGSVGPIRAHLDRIKERYAENEGLVDPAASQVAATSSQSVALSAAAPREVRAAAAPHEVSVSSLVVHDNELVSIKLGDLISLFEDRFDRPLFVWLRSSDAASKFVSLETLAAAGINAKVDPATRQLTFSLDHEPEHRPKL